MFYKKKKKNIRAHIHTEVTCKERESTWLISAVVNEQRSLEKKIKAQTT